VAITQEDFITLSHNGAIYSHEIQEATIILKVNIKVFIRYCQKVCFSISELDQKNKEPL
jgi:hypothetical protein